ncbi:hypothetical protein PR048_010377 [Dryococelus australis]|uniref:Uncharacterized protein n=1 Tax=Dryococelus australis TaxID=614101 RepID=A0ABQ9I2J7_9NEOP|nr:hypothetical protein PR048_010377 [Dryococelus australis]
MIIGRTAVNAVFSVFFWVRGVASAGFLQVLPFPPALAFRRCSILTSLHPSSALKTLLLRAAQTSLFSVPRLDLSSHVFPQEKKTSISKYKAIRVRFPAGSRTDFRMQELRWTMPLVGGFSRGPPVYPALHSGATPQSRHFTLIGSQDLDVKSGLNLPYPLRIASIGVELAPECKVGEKPEILEKTRQLAASFGMIPTAEQVRRQERTLPYCNDLLILKSFSGAVGGWVVAVSGVSPPPPPDSNVRKLGVITSGIDPLYALVGDDRYSRSTAPPLPMIEMWSREP